jgi:hypothetical protein
MKPTMSRIFTHSLAMVLLALAGAELHAQQAQDFNLPLTVALAATVQGDEVDTDTKNGGTVVKFKTTKMSVSNKDILKLIANAENQTLAAFQGVKAKLVLSGGSIIVVDRLGQTLADGYFRVETLGGGTPVKSGSENSDTAAQSYTYAYLLSVSFDDHHGTTFTLYGSITESFSLTATDKNSNQKESDSLTFTGVGDGSVSVTSKDGTMTTADAIFSGKASASGNGMTGS